MVEKSKKRNHVIIQDSYHGDNYFYLSLTNDQIQFFDWLCNEGIIGDDYDLKIVDHDVEWREI